MTNKHASKQHCLVGNLRPKSKQSKRDQKAAARERRAERVSKFQELIKG